MDEAEFASGEPDSTTSGLRNSIVKTCRLIVKTCRLRLLRDCVGLLARNPFPSPLAIGLDHWPRFAILTQSSEHRRNRRDGITMTLQRESLKAETVANLMGPQRPTGLQQSHAACIRQTREMRTGSLGKNTAVQIDHFR